MDGIRVLVVEDFPLTRDAVATAIARHERISVVGTCADADSAFAQIDRQQPDIVLLDLGLPGSSGHRVVTWVAERWPATKVIVFTANDRPSVCADLLELGAAAYVSKRASAEDLVQVVLDVAAGTRGMVAGMPQARGDEAGAVALRPREREVLRLLCRGMADKEIAVAMHISVRTVQNHLAAIRDRVGLRRRSELVRWAMEREALLDV